MVTGSDDEERLHLGTASPWRVVLAEMAGRDAGPGLSSTWDLPNDARPGDTVLHLVETPRLAIIQWDWIEESVAGAGDIDFESIRFFSRGLSVAAVQRRLGFSLPPAPATIDASVMSQVIKAVQAEDDSPTHWRELFDCEAERERFAHVQPPVDPQCPSCERSPVALERHVLDAENDRDRFGNGPVFVCRVCHDRMHAPIPSDFADLVGQTRPPCPECSARRTLRVAWGFPALPLVPGYSYPGCLVEELTPEYECPECELTWTEDDTRYPPVTDPSHYGQVRARIALPEPHPEAEERELRYPGRLVFGSYMPTETPACTGPAWGRGGRDFLNGNDGRLYDVDPRTIRTIEPSTTTFDDMTYTRVVHDAGAELFAALATVSGTVTLTSPFLTFPIAQRLAELAAESDDDWYLLTRLEPSSVANKVLTVPGLRELLRAGVYIRHCASLHAKAYVVGSSFGMVGSANLTAAGLHESNPPNDELSVILPQTEVTRLQEMLDDWWEEGWDVDDTDLDELKARAARLPQASRVPPTGGTGTEPDALAQLLEDAGGGVSLWMKPHYGDTDPVRWSQEGWISSSSKGRPSFAPGDLVVLYSVGNGFHGVVEILSEPRHDPDFVSRRHRDGEKWPWVNRVAPRLIPDPGIAVAVVALGISPHGLQGHKRLDLEQFTAAVRALAPSPAG